MGASLAAGDHDGVDTNPLAPEGVEQLQPGEEWHIDIQHRQIGGVLLQPGQGGPAVLKGLHHLEAGVPLHKGAVQEETMGSSSTMTTRYIQGSSLGAGRGSRRKLRKNEVPTPGSDSTRMSPW